MVDYGSTLWALPLTALITGLLGGLHCLGMCGGVSGSIALATPPAGGAVSGRAFPVPVHAAANSAPAAGRPWAAETNVLAFNAGRIASYSVAGAFAGAVGGIASGWNPTAVISDTQAIRTGLFVFANLMIVLAGLYLLGVPQLLAPLERAGGLIWRKIAPLTRPLLPLQSPAHAALFGAAWGWIPCGMVYAMLLTAIGAGSAAAGALTMLAFGVGTLPAMLAAGFAGGAIARWTRHPRVRLVAGLAVIAIGIYGLLRLGSLEQLQAFGAYCSTVFQSAASNGGGS
jgi:hypothetical protein